MNTDTASAQRNGTTALALPDAPSAEWLAKALAPAQIETMVATVAPGATKDELAVFFWASKRRGLDPFLKQVHFVKRRRWVKGTNGNPDGYQEYAVHQTGIDGFRVIANRAKDETGKRLLAGIKRGPIKDDNGVLVGAWAEVYRHDWKEPARAEIDIKEYAQTDNKGNVSGLWLTKPQTMCEKCAEAAAHRMAFPEDLSDLYINEEMDNAEHVRRADGKAEAEPVTSATVPAGTPVVLDVEAHPVTGTEPTPSGLFDETDDDDRMRQEREPLVKKVADIYEGFAPNKPSDATWTKLRMHFCGTVDLDRADPAALSTFVTFLEGLNRGDKKAIDTLRELVPAKKKA